MDLIPEFFRHIPLWVYLVGAIPLGWLFAGWD